MTDTIELGSCPTCGGPAQFIEGGKVRHVDLRGDTDLLLFAQCFHVTMSASMKSPEHFWCSCEHENRWYYGDGPTPREAVADLLKKVTDGN